MAEVARIMSGVGAQIAALLAYRKSLIHECVTRQRWVAEAESARSPQMDLRRCADDTNIGVV